MSSNKIIGIDHGTLNCRGVVFENGDISKTHEFPSSVSFSENIIIGKLKNKKTIINHLQVLGKKYDELTPNELQSENGVIKNKAGYPKYEVNYRGERYFEPEIINGMIFFEMMKKCFVEENTDAVITVPVYFNQRQRQAVINSAKVAKLNVLRIVNEPTAAAIAYLYENNSNEINKTILIYHMGAESFDATIAKITNQKIEILCNESSVKLGGKYINIKVYDWLTEKLGCKVSYEDVESLKTELTLSQEYDLDLGDYTETISRSMFNELISTEIKRPIKIINHTLKKLNLKTKDVDEVILLGGSTKIIAIEDEVKKHFANVQTKFRNYSARGAAILGANLQNRLPHEKRFTVTECVTIDVKVAKTTLYMSTLTVPFNGTDFKEETLSVSVNNEVAVAVNYHIDCNGVLRLCSGSADEMGADTLERMRNTLAELNEQNVKKQVKSEALSMLLKTMKANRSVFEDKNVMRKYAVIYENICKKFECMTNGDDEKDILAKKSIIEKYVEFVRVHGKKG